MSMFNVILIIGLALGFIVSNIMAIRYMGSFKMDAKLREKIKENNQRYDAQEEQEEKGDR